ncbi:RidA family protein [Sphingobacterium bambusae]|uniref:RidA family protein n=1 Tax=Sphingobacterium bambusae TaxID=662858 RepID=A0ABW6B9Z3_9SPHI|nr:RidA family protein [Sphingobacterium bambusae]WPL48631.1 RidA family protein [Sphingobacterium bambusae]
MKTTNNGRRSLLKKLAASATGVFGLGFLAKAGEGLSTPEKQVGNVTKDQEIPLFSGHTKHGNLVFVAGKGAHFDGDVAAHTKHVLDELEKELKSAGSSLEKVLKVNVYLADLADYDKMNAAYRGRFGNKPPVRTTVATYGGVPGDSLVEMDCIAYV